jgi:hypothetical protein
LVASTCLVVSSAVSSGQASSCCSEPKGWVPLRLCLFTLCITLCPGVDSNSHCSSCRYDCIWLGAADSTATSCYAWQHLAQICTALTAVADHITAQICTATVERVVNPMMQELRACIHVRLIGALPHNNTLPCLSKESFRRQTHAQELVATTSGL